MNAEEEFNNLSVDKSRDRLLLKSFLERHGRSFPELGAKVETRLAEIDDLEAKDLDEVRKTDRLHDYVLFLQRWNAMSISPTASKIVNDRIAELKEQEEQAWAQAAATDKAKAYRAYLKKWPDGAHAELAQKEIGKRLELFDSLFFTRSEEGGRELRLIFGLPGGLILIVLLAPFIGIAGLLLLGVFSMIVAAVGVPGFPSALGAMALGIFVFVKYILGKETEDAVGAVVVVVAATVFFVGLGGWLGLPFYADYMNATGL